MDKHQDKEKNLQVILVLMGCVLFLICTILGYIKLQYGFNFIDEGYHLTEGWRLAVGDPLLKDNGSGSITLYTLMNSQIFKIYPDISLLGFRTVQFFYTLACLFALGIAVYKYTRLLWPLPIIFSLFAFTGLDPTGMVSNLNYYTYPHFFLTLHAAFLILGLLTERPFLKKSLFILSGLSLFGISFSSLYLSIAIISPVIIFLISRKESFSFHLNFKDLCYILTPICFCWLIFIAVYQEIYFRALLSSLQFSFINHWTTNGPNWEAMKHISISMLFLIICFFCIRKAKARLPIICLIFFATLMFLIIDTSLFKLIPQYYAGWFSRPMWFASMLIAFIVLQSVVFLIKYATNKRFSKKEELTFLLLLPATIQSIVASIFSNNGLLNVLHTSILLTAALSLTLLHHLNVNKKPLPMKCFALIIILAPFYYQTAWADWQFTYFDVPPRYATHTIQSGFGKGIKTNKVYFYLYKWIMINTAMNHDKKGFMLSYIRSPMTYMIGKQRPSFDDSFIDFTSRPSHYIENEIKNMQMKDRKPSIALVFERVPHFFPLTIEKGPFVWGSKQFDFYSSNDPISNYIKNHMTLVSEFKISNDNVIRCFKDYKTTQK